MELFSKRVFLFRKRIRYNDVGYRNLLSLQNFFWAFFLLCGAMNNLLDEMFFDPTKLGWSEGILIIVIPAIWLYKKRHERKILGRSDSVFL